MVFSVVNAKLNQWILRDLCNCKLASRCERVKDPPTLRWLILPPSFAVETQNDTSLNLGCYDRVLTISKLRKIHNGASRLTLELTDCRRKRALPANAASEESGASKLQGGAAVRCSDLVSRHLVITGLMPEIQVPLQT